MNKVVYGYYPYWVSGYEEMEWELLSHVAWFAITMQPDGAASDSNGWPSSWTGLVETAHENDVRVDVTFTLFSSSGIETLVNSSVNRANAIETIVNAVEAGGADGASIDFEGVPASAADGFVLFLAELREAFDASSSSDLQISVAGPAVDWSGAFDLTQILPSIDVYFIMGYAYFWSGSSHAGPTGILLTDDFWRTYSYGSELRSMAEASAMVDEAQRAKIVMGVPYYGREWTTADDAIGSTTTGHEGAVTYTAARADLEDPGVERWWDEGSLSPWYAFHDGAEWHQVYYDDEESLAWKYRFSLEQGLGGIGIWALQYDEGFSALWDELEFAFTEDFVPNEGDRDAPIPVSDFPHADSRDSSEMAAGGNFFNFYSCAEGVAEWGREFSYRVEVCHPGVLVATVSGDDSGVDNDVHILSSLSEDACLVRGDESATYDVEPGTYYVVVDTFVDNGVLHGGPFDLLLEGQGIPSPQCDPGQVCVAGECLYPDFDDGGVDGGDVDTDSDTSDLPDSGALCDGTGCGSEDSCGCSTPGRARALSSGLTGLLVAAI
ncbi:MAG: hypothetical protein JRF63_00360 [Deltaproteobacteria bacterium]|nr:hypothetical protein [Deltaproteobacteria bacterium]